MPTDLLPADWRTWDPDAKAHLRDRLLHQLAERRTTSWRPYPWQRPHRHPPDWTGLCGPACADLPDLGPMPPHGVWLQMGGRGTGKTDGAAHYVLRHAAGPPCSPRVRGGHRIAIVAPTIGDAVESCVQGPSGLLTYDPRLRLVGSRGGTYVRWPDGTEAKLFGAHGPNDVERLRSGGNRCLVWLEEAAAMRHLADVLVHTQLGLRIGKRPHYVASTTPKPRAELRKLMANGRTYVTRGRTADAHHLEAAVRDVLEDLYAGTRVGRQELDGELLVDIDGALWRQAQIDLGRTRLADVPDLDRVVVAVDPNAGGPDEAGLVVAGRSADLLPDATGRMQRHAYVLADASAPVTSSDRWAALAVSAYHQWEADAVVGEVNNGGDMVGLTVRAADPTVRYRQVRASRGKAVRAEPVVQLYEQGRVHHVGALPRLEDQMTTWTPAEPWSPDRMDALVWACTDLLVTSTGGGHATAA